MKKVFFILLVILFAMQSEAQNVQVTVGNGTSNTNYCNIPGYYGFHNSAMLFTPSDLQGMRGEIQDLAFDVSSASGSSRAMKIYLKEVAYAALTTSMHMSDFLDGATLVYDQTNVAVTTGWNTFSFTAPFTYTGTSNLLVMVTGTGCTLSGGCSAYQRYTPASGMAWIYAKDTENIDLNTQTGHPTYSAYRFNTRFAITPDPDLCFAPITPLSSNVLSFSATVSWAHHPYSMTTSEWELQYKPASESDWANATVVPVTDTFANLSNLTSATIYNWRVKTICAAGTVEGTDFSIWTNGSFTTEISCPVPTGVQALSESITTEEAVVVWNPCPQALEYEIQYKEYSINSWTDPAVVSTTVSDTAYLMSGLTNNTYYNFRVRATCDIGNDYSAYATCNVRTACGTAITTLPWSDNFDTYGTGTTVFPACWTRNTTYTDRPYVNTTNHSAPGALYFYASTAGNYNIAAIPPIDESIAMNSLRVKGWYFYSNTTAAIEVGIMTDPTDASTFVNVATFLSTGAWMPFEVPLFSYQGEGHYIAFKTDGAIASGYGYIDDIVVELLPECPDVYNLSVIHGSNNSAKVLWNNSITDAAQSGWILAWDELPAASFDPETATNTVPLTTTDMPHFVQSLTPGSTYSFAMRSACTDGVWSATKTITILGASETVSVPYYEDFEVTDTLSFYSSSSTNKWAIGSATGNPGNSMYISNNNGAANAYTITNTTYASASIIVDFGNLVNYPEYALQFDWKAQGEDRTHDYMRVYLAPLSYTHSGAAWPSGTGVRQLGGNFNLNGSWQHASLPISNDCFGTIQKLLFVWWNDLSVGTQPPAAVDNIAIEGFMCVTPSDIQASDITEASANLTWTSTSPATDWILYYKSVDATTVDSVLVNGTTEYPLANLIHSTDYQVWLKTDCGADGLSAPSLVYTFKTLCGAITSVPWTESFDSYGTGNYANFPPCFSRKNTYSATGYPYISTTNHSAPGALYNYASSAGAYSLSTTPKFDEALPLNTLRLKFWHYAPYTASLLKVGVMSDPADVNTFVELQTYTVSATYTWEERELLLNNASDTCHYIAFMTVYASGGYGYGYIDDIVVDLIPACPDVYNFTAEISTNNTVVVGWDNAVIDESESGWIIVYDEVAAANFDPTTATHSIPVTADDMPHVISGLTTGSTYTFAMQAACGGTWTTPISLTIPETVTLPYAQDFEDLADVDEFNLVTGGSNAWHTGNLTGNPGNSMYISNSGTSLDYAGNSYQLATASVIVDFGEYAEYNISFDWKGNGETSYDYMLVYLLPVGATLPTTGGYNWYGPSGGLQITAPGNSSSYPSGRFNKANYSGADTNWQHVSFAISGSLSGTVQQLVFIFQCDGSGQYPPGACVDNIVITGIVCGSPYNVASNAVTQTTADITWLQAGNITDWWLYYAAVGSNVVDSVHVSGSPAYTLSGLAASTPYNVWVKADCGADDFSNNSTVISFMTACGIIGNLPWADNFDTYGGTGESYFPPCWSKINTYISGVRPYISSVNYSAPASLYFYTGTAGTYNIAVTPQFDAAIPINTLKASFWYKNVNLTDKFIIGAMTDPSDASTFVPLDTVQATSSATWQLFEVGLTNYTGTGQYIAFKNDFNTSGASTYAYLDDLVIDTIPSCPNIYHFAATASSVNSVDVSWLTTGLGDNGGAGWTVVYEETTADLFDPNTATSAVQVAASEVPYTISGLTEGSTYTFSVRGSCGSAYATPIQITLPVTIPYDIDFEDPAENIGWTSLSGSAYKFVVGNAVGNPDNAVYTSNTNGASHDLPGAGTYLYYYKDFDFGTAPVTVDIDFDYMCHGYVSASTVYSGVLVYVLDLSTPIPNTFPPFINDNVGSIYYNADTWAHESIQVAEVSGVKRILFFTWGSSSASAPGAAIDNIVIEEATCIVPAQLTAANVAPTTADVSWRNTGADSYIVYWIENSGSTLYSEATVDTFYTITGLTSNTPYIWAVKAVCGTDTTIFSVDESFATPCYPATIPYVQNFDANTNIPSCWTMFGSFSVITTHATSSPNTLRFNGGTNVAVLPVFEEDVNTARISFVLRRESTTNSGSMDIGYLTDLSDATSFVAVMTNILTVANANTAVDTALSAFPTGITNIAFRQNAATSYWYYWLDNLFVYNPNCLPVSDVAIQNLTATAVDIIWTDEGSLSTSWNVEGYSTAQTNPTVGGGNVFTTTVSDTLANITNLTPSTFYYVYVKNDCGWTAHSFKTPCEAISLPYTQNFDANGNLPSCWTMFGSFSVVTTNATSSPNTLRFNSNVSGTTALLPVFDVDVNTARISFILQREGENSGTLNIGYLTDVTNANSFVSVLTDILITEDENIAFDTALSAFPAGITNIAFRQNSSYLNWYYWMDNVNVYSASTTCPAPTSVAAVAAFDTATVTWTENGTATQWQVAWKKTTESIWNYDIATATTYGISGLAAATNYEVQVRAICGEADTSDWSDAATFTTLTCNKPANVEITGTTATSIVLSWEATNGESKWNVIWKSTTATSGSAIVENTPATTLTELTPATDYEICVVAICTEGVESAEECELASTTAIHDITLANSLQLYPNPTTGELRIKNYELQEGDNIEIYNMLGQKQQLTTIHYPLSTINVSHLSAGVYTVKIGGYVGKFVKK